MSDYVEEYFPIIGVLSFVYAFLMLLGVVGSALITFSSMEELEYEKFENEIQMAQVEVRSNVQVRPAGHHHHHIHE